MKRLLLAFSLVFALGVRAEVRPHPLFSDGAVLQRDIAVPIWGQASPGEAIKVRFGDAQASGTANEQGWWLVALPPQHASAEPRDLVIAGNTTVTLHNVVVGDVWLASGQSNMDSPLRSGAAADALPSATDRFLRFFIVAKDVAVDPRAFPKGGQWSESEPQVARDFSAVAFFFAREIRRSQNIPVAIIQASWGGTPIKTWMSVASLRKQPAIQKTIDEWNTALARHHAVKGKPERREKYFAEQDEWKKTVDTPYREALKNHPAAVAAAKTAGKPVPDEPRRSRPEPEDPDPMAYPHPDKRPTAPAITFNAMISPLIPYAIKGALWYQGEADISRAADYRLWLPRLIESWRGTWAQGDFPFLIVQLPGNLKDPTPVATSGIAFLREAQAEALKLPNVGLAVTADIGDPDNVHPDNKVFTGTRLALVARSQFYGENVAGISPRYRSMQVEGAKIRLRFSDVGGGLSVGTAPWRAPNAEALPADKLVGFYVAGENQQWVAADAVIDGADSVVVSSARVAKPVAVRYGWANSPRINLYTHDGVPAAPFRTDTWPQ